MKESTEKETLENANDAPQGDTRDTTGHRFENFSTADGSGQDRSKASDESNRSGEPPTTNDAFPIEAQRFLDRIAPGGRFAFQTFTDSKEKDKSQKDPLAQQFFGSLTHHFTRLKSLNDSGAGVYVAINEIKNNSLLEKNVTKLRAITLDLDGAPLAPVLNPSVPKPHIIIQSSKGKWQLWWCITESTDFETWKAVQVAVAKRFNGDVSIKNLNRVMRVPGFYHKKAEPILVRIEQFNDLPNYTLSELRALFDNNDRSEITLEDARQELARLTDTLAATKEHEQTHWGTGRNPTLNAMLHHMLTDYVNLNIIPFDETWDAFEKAAEISGLNPAEIKATMDSAKKGAQRHADSATPFSEQWLAQKLAERYRSELRFVGKQKKWMWWDGQKWGEDEKRKIFYYSQKVCRDAAMRLKQEYRRELQSAKTRAAAVNLSQDLLEFIATTDQWDADPWLLNTPGGILNLRTGEIGPHRATAYMTKMTAVAPDFDMETPLFDAYLERAQPGEVRDYLQRRYGYALTGLTREEKLDFDYGEGGNGKGTMYNTIAGIMSSYHVTAPISVFLASHNEAHPTNVAHLAGARLATATEIEKGRTWNETQLKNLTGGDIKVVTRRMREDNWEFTPQFKLHISGNNQPNLKSVDEAIRRRLVLVPWSVIIPEKERDDTLKEKLKAEWPGILAWMIKGCLAWQENGLAVPQCIRDATDEYLEAQDPMPEFITTYFIKEEKAKTPAETVYPVWREYKEQRDEKPGRQNQFIEEMRRAGFPNRKDEKGNFYIGLRQVKFARPKGTTEF